MIDRSLLLLVTDRQAAVTDDIEGRVMPMIRGFIDKAAQANLRGFLSLAVVRTVLPRYIFRAFCCPFLGSEHHGGYRDTPGLLERKEEAPEGEKEVCRRGQVAAHGQAVGWGSVRAAAR